MACHQRFMHNGCRKVRYSFKPWTLIQSDTEIGITSKLLQKSAIDVSGFLTEFSILIGNGDRHHGNLSVMSEGATPWMLAPAYDVLPMNYAPRTSGETLMDPLTLTAPNADELRHRRQALPLANEFWKKVAEDQYISPEFRELANLNRNNIRSHARELGLNVDEQLRIPL
ncbi:MAG: hypothetical protein EPO06_06020 [Burkholderiaceae bacterium]|nr:MAG: hypothetical protein EPO06_06020 [Burkholderiaceae bacterium]